MFKKKEIAPKTEIELLTEQNEIAKKQLKLQQKQFKAMAKCPRCGSTSLSGHKKGYGIGKGVVGGLVGATLAGPVGWIGLTAGNIGAKKVRVTCLKCGKRFKA